jgi:hypothetical protein
MTWDEIRSNNKVYRIDDCQSTGVYYLSSKDEYIAVVVDHEGFIRKIGNVQRLEIHAISVKDPERSKLLLDGMKARLRENNIH